MVLLVVIVVATRGGDDGSSPSLSASLGKADVEVAGGTIVTSTSVRIGGVPGRKLTLKWGLVDVLSGRASVQDRVAERFTSTAATVKRDVVVRFPRPVTPSHYIVNFALYGPDGSLLDSSDTGEFVVPE